MTLIITWITAKQGERCRLYLRESSQGNQKSEGQTKTRALKKFELSGTHLNQTCNTAQLLDILTKPHTTGLFISVPITQLNMSGFQQKITKPIEMQEKSQPQETEQA